MDTLLLDPITWDIKLDSRGNIAVATGAYAIAQDVASACRLFSGELWYDTTQGLPYFQQILGKLPSIGFMAARFAAAAETVPEVDSIKVTLNPVGSSRILTGKIEITNTTVFNTTITATIAATVGTPWYVTGVDLNQDFGT